MKRKRSYTGVWILVIVAALLETVSCTLYFTSQAAIKRAIVARAHSELRKAELEIETRTVEHEAALKMVVSLVERYIDTPDSLPAMAQLMLRTMDQASNVGIAFVENYYPDKGKWYEIYTDYDDEGRLGTREIGNADHDYLQMEWYRNGLEHDSCWWSEPYLDDSGAQTMVVTCSHPIRNKRGEIVAVAGIDVPLDYLEKLSEYLQIFKDSYYSIRSSTGQNIVPPPDTVAGRTYYTFDEEIDVTGWRLEIIIPDDVLFADLRHIGLLITLMLLLGIGFLAYIIVHTTKTVRALIESTEQNQRMESELEVAKTIQDAMLPKIFPPFANRRDLNIYGRVDPAKEVGGDLYDFYVREDTLFFCVGDVSGKGVPASLVMAMTRSLFRNASAYEENPEVIVRKMNKAIAEQNTQNMFVTLFLGVLDCRTGQLAYCNAGHNAPVIMVNGEWLMVNVLPNLPLGIDGDFAFRAQQTQLQPNSVLFLYTDGLTEAENIRHEQFGEDRMMTELQDERLRTDGYNPLAIVKHMQASVAAFAGEAPQSDDLTMLAIRYQTPAIIMRNDIEQIPTLAEWMDTLGIPAELNMQMNLALEEIVSNVMLYAYPGESGQVLVEFTPPLTFTITDSGIAFDPTRQAEADTTLSAEEREIGGLGIHLVRQIMDDVHYERIENKNVLTLIKHI